MCDPIATMMAVVSAASTGIGILQQPQHAAQQRGDFSWLAAQQRNEADLAEARARQAEAAGEADAAQARQNAAQRLGQQQARLAAQGTDLLGSPVDVLGDVAASGQQDALSLRYDGLRNAWENRVQGARRLAQARFYETAAANVDPTLGIARSLLA